MRNAAKTGAEKSPSPGTSPMIASSPKRIRVPGTRKTLSSSTAQRRSMSRLAVSVRNFVAVSYLAHAVVRCPDLRRLPLHDRLRRRRQRFLQRLIIRVLGDVLAALRFGHDRMLVLARHCGLDVDPAAMQRSRCAPGLFRIAAQPAHFVLKLARHLRALACVLVEQR